MATLAKPHAVRPTGLRNRAKPEKKAFARQLRRNPTEAEAILWQHIRSKKCNGMRFRRQAVILGWIVDFWCPEFRLVVEVDGSYHKERAGHDARRDDVMSSADISILRLSNDQVLSQPYVATSQIRIIARKILLRRRANAP
jgi:very-short-patch-repair endonuclease